MLAVNNTENHHDGPEFINAGLVAAKNLQAAQISVARPPCIKSRILLTTQPFTSYTCIVQSTLSEDTRTRLDHRCPDSQKGRETEED